MNNQTPAFVNDKPLSLFEASNYLDISKSYLYKLTFQKEIPHFKPNGKKIYFQKSDLDNWIYRNRVSSISEIERNAVDFVTNNKGGK